MATNWLSNIWKAANEEGDNAQVKRNRQYNEYLQQRNAGATNMKFRDWLAAGGGADVSGATPSFVESAKDVAAIATPYGSYEDFMAAGEDWQEGDYLGALGNAAMGAAGFVPVAGAGVKAGRAAARAAPDAIQAAKYGAKGMPMSAKGKLHEAGKKFMNKQQAPLQAAPATDAQMTAMLRANNPNAEIANITPFRGMSKAEAKEALKDMPYSPERKAEISRMLDEVHGMTYARSKRDPMNKGSFPNLLSKENNVDEAMDRVRDIELEKMDPTLAEGRQFAGFQHHTPGDLSDVMYRPYEDAVGGDIIHAGFLNDPAARFGSGPDEFKLTTILGGSDADFGLKGQKVPSNLSPAPRPTVRDWRAAPNTDVTDRIGGEMAKLGVRSADDLDLAKVNAAKAPLSAGATTLADMPADVLAAAKADKANGMTNADLAAKYNISIRSAKKLKE